MKKKIFKLLSSDNDEDIALGAELMKEDNKLLLAYHILTGMIGYTDTEVDKEVSKKLGFDVMQMYRNEHKIFGYLNLHNAKVDDILKLVND